jgi:type IV pilus assembly protein PilM
MFNWFLSKKSGPRLGIDIGSSTIKVVELAKSDERVFLSNYALLQTDKGASLRIIDLPEKEIANLLRGLLEQAGIKSRRASLSLPVDRTFSVTIDLPLMAESELAAAIPFEARKYVPVPLEEIVLDWSVVSAEPAPAAALVAPAPVVPESGDKAKAGAAENTSTGNAGEKKQPDSSGSPAGQPAGKKMQVLVVAVPKEIISRLTRIAKMAGLDVEALEQESFSLARSVLGNDKNAYLMVDLGRKGADLIIVDQGLVRSSHNLDTQNKEMVLMEIDRVVNNFQMRYNKKVSQCLLVGGRGGGGELVDFLKNKLKMPVAIANPFSRVGYDPALKPILPEISPTFAVAVGLAMQKA